MDVSIILVNYNTKYVTLDCLKSIYEKTSGIEVEIIVVDNASIDGSVDAIREQFPEVKIIENPENIGFGRANNVGVNSSCGKYVLFLNTDTVLINNAIKILFDFMEKDSSVGVCGGNLFDEKMKYIHAFGSFDSPLDMFLRISGLRYIFKRQSNNLNREVLQEVDQIIGADLMVRKSVLDQVGLFDRRFFLYFEESELQFRIKNAGYKIFYVPEARIFHLEGASTKKNKKLRRQIISQSQYLFLALCHPKVPKFLLKTLCTLPLLYRFISAPEHTYNSLKYIWTYDNFGQVARKPEVDFVLMSCCTCKRPKMLKQSLDSLRSLALPKDVKVEVLVVDNDEDASGREVVEELQKDFPFKINYAIESQRGISNARNKLLNEAINLGASHIALFDDDEIVDENWLVSHINYYEKNPDAVIVSGPTYNYFEKQYPKYIMKNNIFKSSTTKKTGLIRQSCASGNVFFPTTVMTEGGVYFDSKHVFMGGEDGDFFSRAANAGYTIVWNNDAVNREIIKDDRANIKWLMDRSYYNGYSGVYLKLRKKINPIKKSFLMFRLTVVLMINLVILPLSIIFGKTSFYNALGLTYKTKGKMDALIKNKPLNYYLNISGD